MGLPLSYLQASPTVYYGATFKTDKEVTYT